MIRSCFPSRMPWVHRVLLTGLLWATVVPLARPANDAEAWQYPLGSCTLAQFYEWKKTGQPLPQREQHKRVQDALDARQFLEAYLWATGGRTFAETEGTLTAPVLAALLAPLAGWEAPLKLVPGDAAWYERARRIAQAINLRFTDPPTDLNTSRFSREDRLGLSEILLVDAVDHVEDAQAERALEYQFLVDSSADRFCRWRTFAHATRIEDPLRAFEQASSATLGFPEVLEDLAIDRLRRREEADALDYLLALWVRFPDRARRHVALTRAAYKARLAQLCEEERYDDAIHHLLLSRRFPFEVLDPDMATYAIYYKLLEDENKRPNGGRQALLKFLLNHNVFAEASYVGQAAGDPHLAAAVPDSYRAIIEAQLGNAGMAYRHLDRAVRTEPPTAAFFFALGLATERFKNLWSLAQRCYEQSLLLDPDYEPSLLALAHHDLMKGDLLAAQTRVQRVLDRHPDNDLARYELARILYTRGEINKAAPIFEQLAATDRASPDDFLFLAESALQRHDTAAARTWLNRLLLTYPTNPRARLLLADCARQDQDADEEIEALEKTCALTRPWRFDRMDSARLFQLAADRLAQLDVRHLCSPTFRLESIQHYHPVPFAPLETQSASEWTVPPGETSLVVESGPPPRWIALQPDWSQTSQPLVWRDLTRGVDDWKACYNHLDIVNPSPYDLLGLRVFVDGREFAFLYRLGPRGRVTIRFKSAEFPTHVGLVYSTDTGFQQTLSPEGVLSRRTDVHYVE